MAVPNDGKGRAMSGRMTAAFGAIVLIAMAGLDYGAAANARPEGQPLGVVEHVMDRFAQAKAALGLAVGPPATVEAVPSGPATALIEARLAAAQTVADVVVPSPTVAKRAKPKPKRKAKAKPKKKGAITVGIGTCAKRGGTGKFCSVGN